MVCAVNVLRAVYTTRTTFHAFVATPLPRSPRSAHSRKRRQHTFPTDRRHARLLDSGCLPTLLLSLATPTRYLLVAETTQRSIPHTAPFCRASNTGDRSSSGAGLTTRKRGDENARPHCCLARFNWLHTGRTTYAWATPNAAPCCFRKNDGLANGLAF